MEPSEQALKSTPKAIEAERSVLGAVMLDNRAWDSVIDRLSVDDFICQNIGIFFMRLSSLR